MIALSAVQSSTQTFIYNAILFIDTNAWHNQSHWLIGTLYLLTIAGNETLPLIQLYRIRSLGQGNNFTGLSTEREGGLPDRNQPQPLTETLPRTVNNGRTVRILLECILDYLINWSFSIETFDYFQTWPNFVLQTGRSAFPEVQRCRSSCFCSWLLWLCREMASSVIPSLESSLTTQLGSLATCLFVPPWRRPLSTTFSTRM